MNAVTENMIIMIAYMEKDMIFLNTFILVSYWIVYLLKK